MLAADPVKKVESKSKDADADADTKKKDTDSESKDDKATKSTHGLAEL